MKNIEDLKIDLNALYTTEQAARMLMELEPDKSFEQAVRIIENAIVSGKLAVAGYLRK